MVLGKLAPEHRQTLGKAQISLLASGPVVREAPQPGDDLLYKREEAMGGMEAGLGDRTTFDLCIVDGAPDRIFDGRRPRKCIALDRYPNLTVFITLPLRSRCCCGSSSLTYLTVHPAFRRGLADKEKLIARAVEPRK